MLIIPVNEDALIDGMAPRTDAVSPHVTQSDNPNKDLQTMGGASLPELPNPAIGGENGSKIRNGFSTGFRGIRARLAAFNGMMVTAPAITNPVQGNVGRGNRAASQYVGVLNQLAQYSADSTLLAQDITGVGK